MTNNVTTDNVIVVRSLRQLDALVAEVAFGRHVDYRRDAEDFWQESADGLEPVPRYTTWAGLEPVIARVEAEEMWWDMGMYQGQYRASICPQDDAIDPDDVSWEGFATTAPAAFCIAALAAFGCRVQLELD